MSPITIAIHRDPVVTLLSRPQFVAPSHPVMQHHGDSTDAERLAEFAGRVGANSLQNPAARSTREYLTTFVQRADHDAFAHAHFSFLLEGVSRSLVTDLILQHAHFAYSLRSARFIGDEGTGFVLPPALIGEAAQETAWTAHVSGAHARYLELIDSLMSRYSWVNDKVQRRTLARDAARSVLPTSLESKFVMTGSAPNWRALVEQHAAEGGELEARRLAIALLRAMHVECPSLFADIEIYSATDRREAARVRRS